MWESVKLRCEESLQVGDLLSIIFILIIAMFSFCFFQEREASVKVGRDGDGDCHKGTGCPGASVQSLFCICILSKFIFKLSCVQFVCRWKTFLEFKIFLYFIFKAFCAFVSCR